MKDPVLFSRHPAFKRTKWPKSTFPFEITKSNKLPFEYGPKDLQLYFLVVGCILFFSVRFQTFEIEYKHALMLIRKKGNLCVQEIKYLYFSL